jgi:hypothetical protein
MKPLNLETKVNKNGFLLTCDTKYFNTWAKPLFFSIKDNCPWAHIHFHIFDPAPGDLEWAIAHGCTTSSEITPDEFTKDLTTKATYWCLARYFRVPEIYEDTALVINLDVDSVMVNPLSENEFIKDLQTTWIPTRGKGGQIKSLASAMGFGADNGRHILATRFKDKLKEELFWGIDQSTLNEMLAANEITKMDLRYTDYKFGKKGPSYSWTGKGERVHSEIFVKEINKYKNRV